MTRTSIAIVDIVYQHLKDSELVQAISGKLYKYQRPQSAIGQSEDVVVNALPVNRNQLQEGLVNVNIHVPNLAVRIEGAVDKSLPNSKRLKKLAALAEAVLRFETGNLDYYFEVQQDSLYNEEALQEHYLSFRLEFRSINLE